MAKSSKIKIMISSRCNDPFPVAAKGAKRLSDIRSELKAEIEAVRIFGQPVYEVWINEKAAEDGSQQAWDHCTEQAHDCDVFIALFNGNGQTLPERLESATPNLRRLIRQRREKFSL